MMIISRVRLKSGTLLYCKTGPDSHVCTFLESESLGKRRLLLKSSMQGNLKTQNKTQKHNLHFSYIHIEQHICASIFDICFNEQYFMYMYGTYMLTFYLSSFYQSVHFICTFNTIWTIHEITINLLKEIISISIFNIKEKHCLLLQLSYPKLMKRNCPWEKLA